MGSYLSTANKEDNNDINNNNNNNKNKNIQLNVPTLEEILSTPVNASLLLSKDPKELYHLTNLLQQKKYAIIRPSVEQAEQILYTRKKVEEFFDRDTEFKLRYELPPSQDPLLPTRRNRGYLPQKHKEYLKIRMIDEDNSYPDIPELKENFKLSMNFLYEICFSALLALTSRSRLGEEIPPEELMVTKEEIDSQTPPHPANSSRWIDLSSIQLCNSFIQRGSSVSVVRYLASGEVTDHDTNEYPSIGGNTQNGNSDDVSKMKEEEEEKFRNVCGAHYDTGLLTCIRVSEVPGLQIFDEQLEKWISLEEVGKPGDLVLIMGRKISLVSHKDANLTPTYHRVILPPGVVRHSILYFCDLPSNKDD